MKDYFKLYLKATYHENYQDDNKKIKIIMCLLINRLGQRRVEYLFPPEIDETINNNF